MRVPAGDTLGNHHKDVFCVLKRVNEPVQVISSSGVFTTLNNLC